jgi:hypothetical protein
MAAGDDHLGLRAHRHDRIEHGKALAGAIGSGGRPRSSVTTSGSRAHRRQRRGAVAHHRDLEILIGPFELGLQPGIVLDDQQTWAIGHHATFRLCADASGRRTTKRVPIPSRLSTKILPCMAFTNSRAS